MYFTIWIMFWNIGRIYFFVLAYIRLFNSNFFQSSFSEGRFISSHLYLSIKHLILVILCGSFFISSWFKAAFYRVLKTSAIFLTNEIYCCFFGFYPVKITYIWSTTIRIYFKAFTINGHDRKQTHYHYFYLYFYVNQKVLL